MTRTVEEIGQELGRVLRQERAVRERREQLERELEHAVLYPSRAAWAERMCDTKGCALPVHDGPHVAARPELKAEYVTERPAWATEVTGLEHTIPGRPESRMRMTGWLRNRREQTLAEKGGETTNLAPAALSALSKPEPCPGVPECHRERWHKHFADGQVMYAT